ncbi:MAG TPA: ABC transporter ATP-binding protein [Candidatus Omnitrophica bacterium]|nr:ABC transporter ATP-binding protein [Candidatus Omnitrophota bacterium]
MALISLQGVSLAFGGPKLFDEMTLQIELGERVALLGRNGTGKTTLMRVIAREISLNEGSVVYQKNSRVAYLPQEVPVDLEGTVFDVVLSGMGDQVKLISDYHHVAHLLQTEYSEQLMKRLDTLQSEMDRTNGWEINQQVEQVVAQVRLDPESEFKTLSGGQKRRALLAKALVLKPDCLLLDEPTNHLDIESIDWLEAFLKEFKGTIIFVTHDRMFMTRLATKIVELDRGKLFSWSCDYPTFLERKQMALDAEAAEGARFDKKLAQEEVWIRQGIKARRTRNEGRVRELEKLRLQKKAQRKQIGKVKMQAQEADVSGQVVTKADHIYQAYGDKNLIENFSTRIMRGDKIGIIGPNGCGKTTLLKILLGQMPPQKGTVHLGTNLQVAYYDQLREELDGEKTVMQNVADEGDFVHINGKARHAMGYLMDFLFSPERARTPAKVLSGGERNRLFLARLFTKPCNTLVMDEPTNDLDIETLELLEELIIQYSGTVIVVSHDREFLNKVVTSTIVLDGKGKIEEYIGGYDDWVKQHQSKAETVQQQLEHEEEEEPQPKKQAQPEPEKKPAPKKMTMGEKMELEKIPAQIDKLETEQKEIYLRMADPMFRHGKAEDIAQTKQRLKDIGEELKLTYARWEILLEKEKEVLKK